MYLVILFAMFVVYPAARLSGRWAGLSAAQRGRAWRVGIVTAAGLTLAMWMATLVDTGFTRNWSDTARFAWMIGMMVLMLTAVLAWVRLVSMDADPAASDEVPAETARRPSGWSRARRGARWVLEHTLGGTIMLYAAAILRGSELLPLPGIAMIGVLAVLGGLGGLAYHRAEGLRRSGRRALAMVSTGFVFALLALLFLGVAWVTPSGPIVPP